VFPLPIIKNIFCCACVDCLYKAFYQLKYYGRNDVSVLYALFEILGKVAAVSAVDIKEKVWEFHYEISAMFDWGTLTNLDRRHLQSICAKLERVCRSGTACLPPKKVNLCPYVHSPPSEVEYKEHTPGF